MSEPGQHSTACPFCGTHLLGPVRFCPECGRRLDGEITDQARGSFFTSQRHVFGMAPPEVLLGLALLVLVVAIFLLAVGHWIAGIALLVLGAVAWWFFGWTARRVPEGRVAQLATSATDATRSRAGFAWVSVSSWSEVGLKALRLQRVQHGLRREQSDLIYALGEAVFHGDSERAEQLKDEARACAERIEANAQDLEHAREAARERVGRERAAFQPTEALAREQSEPPPAAAPQ